MASKDLWIFAGFAVTLEPFETFNEVNCNKYSHRWASSILDDERCATTAYSRFVTCLFAECKENQIDAFFRIIDADESLNTAAFINVEGKSRIEWRVFLNIA